MKQMMHIYIYICALVPHSSNSTIASISTGMLRGRALVPTCELH